jgi:tetratricopeptide (TPR) repeat protein
MPVRKRPQSKASTPSGASEPSDSAALGERWAHVALGFALLALAFIVYAPVLGGGFIWDDARAITDNLAFHAQNPLRAIWAGRGDPDYFPLKTTVLWLVYRVFGGHAPAYHVLNVALHAANAILLWRVLARLALPGAFLAALVFMLHPTHVESVAWISECKNTLSMLFGLLAALAWLGHQRSPRPRRYLLALALFVTALLCKTQIVVFPLVLLLVEWWQHVRPGETGREAAARAPFPLRAHFVRLVPFFAASALLGATTIHFQNDRAIAGYRLPMGALASRVTNAGKATWWYLGKALSPVHPWYEMPSRPIENEGEAQAFLAGQRAANPAPSLPVGRPTLWPLAAIYPRWRVTPPVWYDFLPGLAMVALYVFVVRGRHGRGAPGFVALSYFLLALLPVLGLLPMSYMRAAWVADHFQYLANVGIIAWVAAGAALAWRRGSLLQRRAVAGTVGAVVALFAGASFVRASDFKSELALWSDTVAKNPGAWQAQGRLGAALLARRHLAAAAEHMQVAIRLNPDDPDTRNNLGIALVGLGRVQEGIEQYRQSLRLNARQFSAHANLADALAAQKRYPDAIAEYRAAIAFRPTLAPLHFRLAAALLEAGHVDAAITSLEQADRLAPRSTEVATALARARGLRDAGAARSTTPPSPP